MKILQDHGRRPTTTSFLEFLGGFLEGLGPSNRIPQSDATMATKFWVQCLIEIGVDLQQYGKIEHRLFAQELINSHKNPDCGDRCDFRDFSCPQIPLRLVDFTYGPHPDDWSVTLERSAIEYSAQFWELAERLYGEPKSENRIPGGWVDDDSHLLPRGVLGGQLTSTLDMGLWNCPWHGRFVYYL